MLPDSLYEVSITLITKTRQKCPRKENYKYLSGIQMQQILNKTVANQIQQHTKSIVHHDYMGFTPGMQG